MLKLRLWVSSSLLTGNRTHSPKLQVKEVALKECSHSSLHMWVYNPAHNSFPCFIRVVSAVSLAMGHNDNDNVSVPKAPTKEEMSFSTYTARRKLNRLRRSACQLFTSDAMVKAIQRLEVEVEAKRLLVRKDRHLWKDIGNYETCWCPVCCDLKFLSNSGFIW